MPDDPSQHWDAATGRWLQWNGTAWEIMAEQLPPPGITPVPPRKPRTDSQRVLIAGGIIVGLAALFGGCTLYMAEVDKSDDGITAYVACQVEIEKVLKSPGTADYPPMSSTNHYNDGNRWDFRSYVDSQNGFGGVVRTDYACDAVVLGETGVVNRLVVDGQPIIGQ